MNPCKKCHSFLCDYLDQALQKRGVLYTVGNPEKIRENLDTLIPAILRAQATLTDWILKNMKGEVEMRVSLVKKPETKEEEYLLTFYVLLHLAQSFRSQMKQIEDLSISLEFVKLKRTDKSFGRKDQFLANLFVPLIEILYEIHTEHTSTYKSIPLKEYIFDDTDLLYS